MNTKLAIGAALGGAVILGATIAGWSAAQSGGKDQSSATKPGDAVFSELEEEEIGEIIRAYLLENPEVIIEAVNAYSARERLAAQEHAKASARENLTALLDEKTAYVAGADPSKAKVAVVELFDYHCSFCKRAADNVKKLAESDKDVKVIFRELPILRQESELAAEMALAAREQGKFLDFHFAMMNSGGVLTPERIEAIAKEQGLNVAALKTAAKDKSIAAAISENHRLADQMRTDGTPTFIVASLDGSYVDVLEGYRPDVLAEMVEAAKKAAK